MGLLFLPPEIQLHKDRANGAHPLPSPRTNLDLKDPVSPKLTAADHSLTRGLPECPCPKQDNSNAAQAQVAEFGPGGTGQPSLALHGSLCSKI